MRVRLKTLRLLIREAARDQKQLQKINSQLTQKGRSAPYSEQTLRLINEIPDADLNLLQNRKGFIKWFASVIETEKQQPTLDQIQYIITYIAGANPDLKKISSFEDAFDDAEEWHENIEQETDPNINLRKDNKVIYKFNNGYKIVELKQRDLIPEGQAMGNCLKHGKYKVTDSDKFYSLRDSYNKPHATISIVNDFIDQIKGKENTTPIKKYSKMIIEWISTLQDIDTDYSDFYSILVMASNNPQQELLKFVNNNNPRKRAWAASLKTISPEILTQLANDKAYVVVLNVARNESTPHSVLIQLAKSKNEVVRQNVALNTSTPLQVMFDLANDIDTEVRRSVALNKAINFQISKKLAKDRNENVRQGVALNEKTDIKILSQLAKDRNENVRQGVALNENVPDSMLAQLAEDLSTRVRSAVAENEKTPLSILEQLIKDKKHAVRQKIALNEKTTAPLLVQLAKDKDFSVRLAVIENLATPKEVLIQFLKDENSAVVESAMYALRDRNL